MSNKLVLGANVINGAYLGTTSCLFIEYGGKLIAPTFNPGVTTTSIKNEFVAMMGSGYTVNKVSFYSGQYFDNSVNGQVETTRFGEMLYYDFYCLQGFNIYHGAQFSNIEFMFYWTHGIGTQLQAVQILTIWYAENFVNPMDSISNIVFVSQTAGAYSIDFNFRVNGEKWTVAFNKGDNGFSILNNWY